jgi:hypothetical protein
MKVARMKLLFVWQRRKEFVSFLSEKKLRFLIVLIVELNKCDYSKFVISTISQV